VLGYLPLPRSLERPEILVPVSVGYVRVLAFPFGEFEEILLGELPLFGAIAQMSPPLSGQPLPLNLGHASAAQDQGTELIHQAILLIGIVVCQIVLQFLEEFAFASLVAVETKSHQRGDRLAHAGVDSAGVALDLVSEAWSQSDCIPGFGAGPALLRRSLSPSPGLLRARLNVRHISSWCLILMYVATLRLLWMTPRDIVHYH